jgi:hypothetical protein
MYVNFFEYEGCLLLYSVISDLRVREVNLVYEYEYTHSLNEKCFSSAM